MYARRRTTDRGAMLSCIKLPGLLAPVLEIVAVSGLITLMTMGGTWFWRAAGRPGGDELLVSGVIAGERSWIADALRHGADVNARDALGQTALMWAAVDGDEDLVRTLIASGADLSARSDQGDTALALAAKAGQPGTMQLLLRAGGAMDQWSLSDAAEVRAPNQDGW